MLKENYKEMAALKILYEANKLGVWLWLQGDVLKFKAPENSNTEELFVKIKQQKNEIIEILKCNRVFNSEPLDTFIYQFSGNTSPLSFAQERLWFAEQFEQGTNAYHIPFVFELPIDTDLKGIEYAIQKIVVRHQILRTTIEHDDVLGQHIQKVNDAPLTIKHVNLYDTLDYHDLIKKEIDRPFNLSSEYPIRSKFYVIHATREDKIQPHNRILLVVNIHHIATDGWSSEIFQNELFVYYTAYTKNNGVFDLPQLDIQYKDYALWQKTYLTENVLQKQLDYWKGKLNGYTNLQFPTDFTRPSRMNYKGSKVTFKITKNVSQKIKSLAKQHAVTIHSVMLSGLHLLLSKYTGQNDIVTGSPNANRNSRQTESLIGFFINTQVNRTILNPSQNFEELIKKVHQDQIESQLHQDLPFEKLVKEIHVERDLSRHPIFQVIFEVVNHSNLNKISAQQEAFLKHYQIDDIYSEKFDMSIFISVSEEEITGDISYATSLYAKDTLTRFCEHYINLLTHLLNAPTEPYSGIKLFNSNKGDSDPVVEEYRQLVTDFNSIPSNYYQSSDSVIDLFKQQIEKNPDASALIYEGKAMSYRELDKQSDKLARYLRTNFSLPTNALIAVLLDRSDKMLISILAILKVGAAYVPIDPGYPNDRRIIILKDAAIQLLITQTDYMFELNDYEGDIFAVDVQLDEIEPVSFFEAEVTLTNLAYVIYTSGSTGKPKGCAIRHSNLSHYIKWANAYYFKSDDDGNFGLYTSISFDLTVTSIFCVLTRGKCLTIFPQQVEPAVVFEQSFCSTSAIDSIKLTPSHIKLIEQLNLSSSKIKLAIVGGEAVNESHVAVLKAINPEMHIYNEYGPTETTVGCVVQELGLNEPVLIGKPIYGTRIYVLSNSGDLLPIGAIGEIYIGGLGVCDGYLNKKELTQDKFITNPFVVGERLYRTGDLGRWLPNGTLEYKGRNDDQVKIRGYRVELSEIEHALMQVDGIRQACVVIKDRETKEDTINYLVGYYVSDENNDLSDQTEIKAKLSKVLPEYMIPSAFIRISSFPLTPNGKIDKRSLLDVEAVGFIHSYVPPGNDAEIAMCKVWEEVLGISRVGTTDNFFSIGGDSIISIRVVSRLKQLGFNTSVSEIFRFRTVREIVKNTEVLNFQDETTYQNFSLISNAILNGILNERNIPIEDIADAYPASYLQSGMLIESLTDNKAYFNVDSFVINKKFEPVTFKNIWSQLIDKHEQLRTAYVLSEIGYVNIVYHTVDLDAMIIVKEQYQQLEPTVDVERQVGFNFESPGIFRLLILPNESNGNFILLFSHHHVIGDGWSVASLIADFIDAYVHGKVIQKNTQPSYGKFIRKELESLTNSRHQKFWLDYLSDYELKSNDLLISDLKGSSDDLIVSYQKLDSQLNGKLLRFSKEANIPLDIVFLGVYNLVLSLFYNDNDLVIGTVTNNRLEEEGGDRLFGLFLNTIPMRINIDRHLKKCKDYLFEILANKLKINDHQSYPYAKIKSDLNLEQDIYNCSFNYIHFHIEEENYEKKAAGLEYSLSKTNLPLVMDIARYKDTFTIVIEGNPDFIDRPTSEKIIHSMIVCLEQMINYPEKYVDEYQLLTTKEYHQVVRQWNATSKYYPKDITIYELFQRQVASTPDKVAVVYDNQALTYNELNEKSNQLARHIRSVYKRNANEELKPDAIIVLCLDRSLELVIGMMAVLKAGAAYLPIDPSYPQDRVDYIIADTETKVILSLKDESENCDLELPSEKVLYISLSENLYKEGDTSNLTSYSKSTDIAYVIYTSGTTGKPKASLIEHHSFVNLNKWYSEEFNLTAEESFIICSEICFDLTQKNYFSSLITGASIYIPRKGIYDPTNIAKMILQNKISRINCAPSAFTPIFNELYDQPEFKSFSYVFLGGEPISDSILEAIKKRMSGGYFVNSYGPSECCDVTTFFVSSNDHLPDSAIPLGTPVNNFKHYVLNHNKHPVPVGVVGELYISGAGLSRGYLNSPELTAERFIPNIFATAEDREKGYTRLYKTGDLVKWLPDGNLLYIGRNDDQVKIRGYRIELGEIEHALTRISGIKQACVLAKARKTQTTETVNLIAYYVLSKPKSDALQASDIQDELLKSLPDYMVPSTFHAMEAFPLTINGKLNKRGLPDIDVSSLAATHVEPETENEITVCAILEKMLGINKVGVTDDFFRIGGNSITAIQLSHQISQALKCNVKVADIFRFRTIRIILKHADIKSVNEANVNWELSI